MSSFFSFNIFNARTSEMVRLPAQLKVFPSASNENKTCSTYLWRVGAEAREKLRNEKALSTPFDAVDETRSRLVVRIK